MATLQVLKIQSNQMKKICTIFVKHINKTTNFVQHFPKKKNFNDANRSNKTIVRNYHSAVAISKKIQPTAINTAVATEEERKEYLNYFPHIVNDVVDTSRNVELPGLANSLKMLTEYNVPYVMCVSVVFAGDYKCSPVPKQHSLIDSKCKRYPRKC
ncbi:hypothetical protein CBL_04329 [Carabus blaptoides fortunei]